MLDLDALKAIGSKGRASSTKQRKALVKHEPRLAHTRSPLEEESVAVEAELRREHGLPA